MIKRIKIISLIIAISFSSCSKTSTPKEYLHQSRISFDEYKKDVRILEELTLARLDSIRDYRNEKGVYSAKSVKVIIDTIFYESSSNKIVYLCIKKIKNKYATIQDSENKEGIEYDGECYIGKKDITNNTFIILKNLKYSTSTPGIDGYHYALKALRLMYFREMNYIDKKYNINDTRFWDSIIWQEID